MTVKLSQSCLSVSIKCEHELNEQMRLVFPHVDSLLTFFPIHPLPLHHTSKIWKILLSSGQEKLKFLCFCVCF